MNLIPSNVINIYNLSDQTYLGDSGSHEAAADDDKLLDWRRRPGRGGEAAGEGGGDGAGEERHFGGVGGGVISAVQCLIRLETLSLRSWQSYRQAPASRFQSR